MKLCLILICAVLAATSSMAKVIRIHVRLDQGQVSRTISDRPVTEAELAGLLRKLGSIDTNQLIVVSVASNTPASTLTETLSTIQQAGLVNVALFCAGQQNGTNGSYQITLKMIVLPITGDVLTIPMPVGFVPGAEPKETLENIEGLKN